MATTWRGRKRERGFCAEHATAGTLNGTKKKCGDEGCLKYRSYGASESKTAELCSEHARARMVTVKSKGCGCEVCFEQPSYGVVRNEAANIYAEQAITGTVHVKECGDEGCSEQPWHCVLGGKKASSCSERARVGRVGVGHGDSGMKWCSDLDISKRQNLDEAQVCGQHATIQGTTAVFRAGELNTRVTTPGCSPTQDGRESVADVRVIKRKRAACSGSRAAVGTCRSVRPSLGKGGAKLPLLSRAISSASHAEVLSAARAVPGVKVEPTVPFSTRWGTRARTCVG